MNKYEPKISIIVPVRNAARTLETTFEYLLNVEYPQAKMEILMADGESTDNTVQIIKDYQKKYSFIKSIGVAFVHGVQHLVYMHILPLSNGLNYIFHYLLNQQKRHHRF